MLNKYLENITKLIKYFDVEKNEGSIIKMDIDNPKKKRKYLLFRIE